MYALRDLVKDLLSLHEKFTCMQTEFCIRGRPGQCSTPLLPFRKMAEPTMVDDQTLDTEGWEIANGQKEEHPHNSNCCPDVVLKAQKLPGGKNVLQCPICLNGYKYLKNLGCHCNVCLNCAERLLVQWQDGSENEQYQKTRLCTTCDQEHSVPSLAHKLLKPVFGRGALKCMSCQNRKDTQDGWWCQDCSLILCSKCAHKGHRDHATVEFDQDYEAVRFCLGMFQVDEKEIASRFKSMTWAKFEEIFKIIESAIDQELESQNKMRRARLTDVFGKCSLNQQGGGSGYDRLQRRLSVIQQRAKQQFPSVLDEILSLSDLGTRESIDLRTDIVAKKIVALLKSAIDQLSVEDFKLTREEQTCVNEDVGTENAGDHIMYVGEVPPTVGNEADKSKRHY